MKTINRQCRNDNDITTQTGSLSSSSLVSNKIDTQHLAKLAVVYVRQSSPRQVRENIESTQLQYDLARRAETYGWPSDRIEIIDDDLGVSGKSLEGRGGFQRLLAEIPPTSRGGGEAIWKIFPSRTTTQDPDDPFDTRTRSDDRASTLGAYRRLRK